MAKRIVTTYLILSIIFGFYTSYASTIREQVVTLAKSYIGIKETSNNRGPEVDKIIRQCGYNPPIPYCGCFVFIILDSCGVNTAKYPAAAKNWFTKNVITKEQVLPGSLAGIYFPARKDIHHVGIVDTITKKDFIYTSGNSNNAIRRSRLPITRNIYFSDWIKTKAKYHIVKPQETLYRISIIYSISINDLKTLNNLTSNHILIGQKLIVNGESN